MRASTAAGFATFFAAGLLGTSALADQSACDQAFSAAPQATKDGHFAVARKDLLRCGSESCPSAMRPLCLDDLRQLESRIPSLVFAAQSADGRDLVNVRVSEGDATLQVKLDGRAVDVDPGAHTFRMEVAGAAPVTMDVLVREGEKARPIIAKFAAPMTPVAAQNGRVPEPTLASTRPLPWSFYVAGGVALAASATWAYFGIDGISERSDLKSCYGHCSASAVETATHHLDIADGFMVASILAWGATATFFFTRPTVAPVLVGARNGGTLGVVGRF